MYQNPLYFVLFLRRFYFFFLMFRRQPRSPLFPYPSLFRSTLPLCLEPTPSSISLNFSLNFALRRRGRYGYFPLFGRKTPASRRYYGAKVAIIFQISNFQGQIRPLRPSPQQIEPQSEQIIHRLYLPQIEIIPGRIS